jgi:hypothetical protein
VHAYATAEVYGRLCQTLGRHKLSEVYKAANEAAAGRCYTQLCIGPHRYNCNDWCEDVAAKLGHTVTCSATCTN